MQPRFTVTKMILEMRNPFRLSYGVDDTREAYWLRLADDAGWGEGAIPPYYRVNDADMLAAWERLAAQEQPFPDAVEDIPAWVGSEGPAVSRCAVDLALHDRIGKLRGEPVYRLLGLPEPPPLPTSFTVSGDPDAAAREASEAARFTIIKIKLGSGSDEEIVTAVRQARPDVRLFIDANAGWTLEQALGLLPMLERNGVELVEQPLAKDDIEGMGRVQSATALPVVADESLQSVAQLEQLAQAGVRGINLKLMKLGGLATALRIVRRARELGMGVMLGSMIETSIGVTAMGHLAGLADWLDLDSPLLISNDPFTGIAYSDDGRIHVPSLPGIGVTDRGAR